VIDVAFRVMILALTRLPKAMLAVERYAVVAFRVRILAVIRFARPNTFMVGWAAIIAPGPNGPIAECTEQ